MQTVAQLAVILASFTPGEWEIVLVLALVLFLFSSGKLDDLGRGLVLGLLRFGRATKRVTEAMDEEAQDAGRSVGGIYGKPAAQALTPDNLVAELYDPVVLQPEPRPYGPRNRVMKALR